MPYSSLDPSLCGRMLRSDVILRHPHRDRQSYLIALAYCRLLWGTGCWQWKEAWPEDKDDADALIKEAQSKPRYIRDLAAGVGA